MKNLVTILLLMVFFAGIIFAGALAAGQEGQGKTFTLEQLKQFDGRNGRPAYAAVNGIVYDLSKIGPWKGGKHMNKHFAGRDLTAEFQQAPQDIHKNILQMLPKVGTLIAAAPAGKTADKVKSKPAEPAVPDKTNKSKAEPKPAVVKDYKVQSSFYGKLAICPVTKQSFKITAETLAARYKGQHYYFCCPACKETFQGAPDQYAKLEKPAGSPAAPQVKPSPAKSPGKTPAPAPKAAPKTKP
jgi:predicted heme/steroid binding protein/YHS domain-containing protein